MIPIFLNESKIEQILLENKTLDFAVRIFKKMKNKTRLFLLFALPLFFLYISYFLVMDQYVFSRASYRVNRARVSLDYAKTLENKEIDYLIMGDSSALFAINPLGLSKDSYSIAVVASTLFSSYKSLNSINGLKVKKGIFISQTFIRDHYDKDIWGIFVPAKIINRNDVLHFFCFKEENGCSAFERFKYNINYILSRLYLNSYVVKELFLLLNSYNNPYGDSIYASFLFEMKQSNGYYKRSGSAVKDQAIYLAPYYENFSRPIYFNVPNSEKYYLQKIIDFAKKNNVTLYYVFVPTAATKLGVSIDLYRQSVLDYLRPEIGASFQILDISPIESSLRAEDFWDFNHVNSFGSKKVTDYIKLYLNK